MYLADRLASHRDTENKLAWNGTFAEYFDLVVAHPTVARLSHARMYDMLMQAGVTGDKEKSYGFFANDLFGVDKALQQLVDYFSSSARRLEVRKRILLLMGPVSAGKSTIVTMLKRGVEQYSRTDDGAVYAITHCPMHEEPLHLIPDAMRAEIFNDHGIYIEGDLCPVCRQYLLDHDNDIESVPVERITFSEKQRVGIGTFAPSDSKSQDVSELTGSMDLATIGQYGSESDPRAYRFDGEMNIANRGMIEFIEMLKAEPQFLYGLLTLSQEQNIKTSRFAMIYADEVIVAHSNEHEYNAFVANKKSEALQDRIIVIKVPYNLRLSDEVKIYQKLLVESALANVHIAPGTLSVVSTFAILSRLEASKKAGMSLQKKMRLYDGDEVDGFTEQDLREVRAETVREGMDGVSPRYIINRLSQALIKDNLTCLHPIDALRALRDGFEQHTSIGRDERERLLNLITDARKEYDDFAKSEVQRAFVYSFEESARTLLNNYLDNVEAFCNKTKIKDPITEEPVDPDERLMRSIEEQIGITDSAKTAFRQEILIRLSALARKGVKFEYRSHEKLKDAIEKKLFGDLKDIVKITTSTKTPDADQLRKINDVVDRLISHEGYCPVCANEMLKYVGTLLAR